jgi:two-component system, LytTR family, sensor kinase
VPALSRVAVAATSLSLAFALALTEAAQVVLTADGPTPLSFTGVLGRGLPTWLLLGALAPVAAAVCRRWRLELRPRSLARHAALAVAFAISHILLLAAFKTTGRWPELAFAEAVRSAIFYNLAADVLIYWVIAAIVQVVEDSRRLRQQEADAHALGASLAEARLDALRAQLQPHFLYNVLNTAAMLAREQRNDETVTVLARLGELLRYVLREGSGEASLGDELAFLRRYLELEQLRFADRLHIEILCDPALEALRLPALLLQPLVENAVRHGIARKPGAGAGTVAIRVTHQNDRLEIEVRDDGPGLAATPARTAPGADDREGIGLRNTRDRLAQRYGSAAHLELCALDGGGTAARLHLPAPLAAAPRAAGAA